MSDDERGPEPPEWRTDESWTGGMDPTVPALCERCWFPILPGQTARRTPIDVSGPRFIARLVSFVHCAPVCTPQEDDDHGSEAA